MKLYYYRDPLGNFGDDLNAWLWPRLIPEMLDDDDSSLFVGIGSILDSRIPHPPRKVVFGTGIGYGRLPALDERWHIYCVRGPLTAQALGLPPGIAITDPAALTATVPLPPVPQRYSVSFMPHFRTPALLAGPGVDVRGACEDAGIHYIDPSCGVDDVLTDIRSSGVLIAEAMHGAIVADALRVPWTPVKLYTHVLDLKWWDWCKSLGLEYEPSVFDPTLFTQGKGTKGTGELTRFLVQTRDHTRPATSRDQVAVEALRRLQERVDVLRSGSTQGVVRGSTELTPDPDVFRGVPWLYEINLSLTEIAALVPVGEAFILVDERQWGGGELLAGRRAIPFTERDGQYWGPPPDDETAIREVERLRAQGAHSIVFAWPAFWWLDYYPRFHRHLSATYNTALENDRLVAFLLNS